MMFRRDSRSAFADLKQVQLPEMHHLQRSKAQKYGKKPGAELFQVQVTDYAEVYCR